MIRDIELNTTDQNIYNNEIKPLLPKRIFDAHCHIQIPRFNLNIEELFPMTQNPLFHTIDMSSIKLWWKILFPDSALSGLILPTPTKGCDIHGINKFMSEEIDSNGNRFSIMATPMLSEEDFEKQIVSLKPHGIKPYMCFSPLEKVNESGICDFLPESHIAIADKYGLAITLHVAKPRGMADPDNLNDITRLVKEYPNCNFILAHCGRCFIAPNMEDALKKLPVAQNLWIDTSAVCDTGVFLYLLNRYEKSQILFGTDLVTAAGFRGSYVRMGASWDMITEDMINRPGGQEIRATFAAYENLCAMLHAAKFSNISETDLNNIFYNNAAKLFNLE